MLIGFPSPRKKELEHISPEAKNLYHQQSIKLKRNLPRLGIVAGLVGAVGVRDVFVGDLKEMSLAEMIRRSGNV